MFTRSIPFRFQSQIVLHQPHLRFSLLLVLDYAYISYFAPLSHCTYSASTILFCILADSIPTLLYFSTFLHCTYYHSPQKKFHGFEPNFVFSCYFLLLVLFLCLVCNSRSFAGFLTLLCLILRKEIWGRKKFEFFSCLVFFSLRILSWLGEGQSSRRGWGRGES